MVIEVNDIFISTFMYTAEVKDVDLPKLVDAISRRFIEYGFKIGMAQTTKYSEIYYDANLTNNTLKNFLFYGGMCRQVFMKNQPENDIFLECKYSVGDKLKRFKVDKPANATQIKNQLRIRMGTFRSVAKTEVEKTIIPFVQTDEKGNITCVFNLVVDLSKMENPYSDQQKQAVFVHVKMAPEFVRFFKKHKPYNYTWKDLNASVDPIFDKLNFKHIKLVNKYDAMFKYYFEDVYEKSIFLPF